eukprot:9449938-Pyramimonas_sp.AAC.1
MYVLDESEGGWGAWFTSLTLTNEHHHFTDTYLIVVKNKTEGGRFLSLSELMSLSDNELDISTSQRKRTMDGESNSESNSAIRGGEVMRALAYRFGTRFPYW